MKRKIKISKSIFLLIFCAILFYIFTYVLGGKILLASLDDIYFHINRIMGLDSVWNYPIDFKAFNHIGEAVNYFYP